MKKLLLLILVSLLGSISSAASPDPDDSRMLATYLDRMAHFGFSGSVYVSRGETVLVDEGFGRYDCADGRLVRTSDKFAIASLSKSFTAAAIMSLVDEGLLGLDDTLGEIFDDVPEHASRITVEQLLMHRSGIGRLSAELRRTALSPDEVTTATLSAPLAAEPGTTTLYSNEGYALLAAMVGKRSGESFESYVRMRLLEPAGLQSTNWVTEDVADHDDRAIACRGDLRQGDPYRHQTGEPSWTAFGATGLVSTAADLGRWAHALMCRKILSDAAHDQIFRSREDRFGAGWVVQEIETGRMIWHDGLLLPEGWNGQVRTYPDHEIVIVVLSNRYDGEPLGWQVARDLDRLLFGGEVRFPPPAAAIDLAQKKRLRFETPRGEEIVIDTTRSTSYLEWSGQEITNLFLDVSEEESERLEKATRLTGSFLTAFSRGTLVEGVRVIPHRDPETWLPQLESSLESLETTFGKFVRATPIHSVSSPNHPNVIETCIALPFENGRSITRLLWIDGQIWSFADEGSFLGESRSLSNQPGRIPLAQAGDRLVGYDIQFQSSISLELERNSIGEVQSLVIRNGSHHLEASTSPPR